MSAVEQDLTQVLHAYAELAPDDLGLLSRVQVASSRRRRRRGIAVVVAAVASVVAVAAGVVSVPHREASDRFADPTGFLVDGRESYPKLPVSPSFLPPGTTGKADVYGNGTYGEARWILGTPVTLQVSAEKSSLDRCDARECALNVEHRPGQWVMVNVLTVTTGDDARALAQQVLDGLRDEVLEDRPEVLLGLVPAGDCRPQQGVLRSTSISPSGPPERMASSPCFAGVQLFGPDEADRPRDGNGEEVVLGGYEGWLVETDIRRAGGLLVPGWNAVLKTRDGGRLLVSTPRVNGWDREELDRFVRAVILPK